MIQNGMLPIHPGEIIREEYLEPTGMSVSALSRSLHVPVTRINEIVRENRGITRSSGIDRHSQRRELATLSLTSTAAV
tara:strand:+ start:479 stop:712 length:234 start_codon:yes stop_codon:yes gene_type:complete